MDGARESLRVDRPERRRLGLRDELLLAAPPTAIILIVLVALEVLSRQRLLFASLASSAFLIYLDPLHATNSLRTIVTAHLLATASGLLTYWAFGHGYLAAGSAMVATAAAMIVLDVVHPPALSTSLTFAYRYDEERTIVLFLLALAVTALLVLIERSSLWLMARLQPGRGWGPDRPS